MNVEARAVGAPVHEQVYRRLRDAILFGVLTPGQAVTIQGLVDLLGAGMTPVREAMRRLTAEGALETLGNRRIVVPVLGPDALAELTEARLAIEPRLARRATENADKSSIRTLCDIDEQLDAAIALGDIPAYLRLNHGFHASLNGLAQAPILHSVADSLWLRFGPSMRVVCGRFGTANLPDRHKDLIAALQARNGDSAYRAMQADVEQGMALLSRSF